jgi:hypothetical protein
MKEAANRYDRREDYFTSVITGLSLALMRITSVFESLSVAFRPKCFVFGGVYTTSPALTILVPTPSISKVCYGARRQRNAMLPACLSVLGGQAEEICSHRAFTSLTLS